MFQLFVSTRALGMGQLRAIVFSVAAHTGLIVMAIAPSSAPPSSNHEARDRDPRERVHFVAAVSRGAAPRVEKSRSKSASTRSTPAIAFSFSDSAISPIPLPDAPALADVDFSSMITDSLDFAHATLADVIGDLLGRRKVGAIDGVYTAESVEKSVTPLRDNPPPVYPTALASAGIEAAFVVNFVVDSTGHVDTKSVEFPSTPYGLFIDAVRRSLLRSRYIPAEVDGRRVPQRVAQEFVFRMQNGRALTSLFRP